MGGSGPHDLPLLCEEVPPEILPVPKMVPKGEELIVVGQSDSRQAFSVGK